MGLFSSLHKNGGLMDEIRCDEQSYLIWKWHPKGSQPGKSNKENGIRWGSSLRVKDGEVAVFVYNQPDGPIQEYIEGPYDKILDTNNLPILSSILGLAYNGGTPFQAEVYFINLANIIQLKFGVPFFDVYDPRFTDFGVPVAVRGTLSFKITDYEEFIKLHRLSTFDLNEFEKQVKDALSVYIKDAVTNAPAENNIPVIQLENKISLINEKVEYKIKERMAEEFGVTVSSFDIGKIEIDKNSDEFHQLMNVTKTITSATVQAQAEANIRDILEKQRIESENYEETLRLKRKEEQYATHKQTQTANFAAYQTEAQENVGIAGADALGKMGSKGSGGINLGSGSGFNPASMMAGMALGGAVGNNIANTMNGIMNNTPKQAAQQVPPPIPNQNFSYHVVIDGKAMGPYNYNELKEMANNNQISSDTLVWKNGMSNWEKAGSLEDFNNIIVKLPPIPGQ